MTFFFAKSLSRRLVATIFLLTLGPLLILASLSIYYSQQAMQYNAFEKLQAVEKIKKEQIIQYFKGCTTDISVLSSLPIIDTHLQNIKTAMNTSDKSIANFIKTTDYQQLYDKMDSFFKNYTDKYGYYDLFLIDDDGNVIYTNKKESDLGSNLNTGIYSKTNLAELYKNIWKEKTNKPMMVDFRSYSPSNNMPASFLGIMVHDSTGKEHGVLALQIPINQIDHIMQETVGLGNTGETYLVGPDLFMRSDSRFLKEGETTILRRKIDTIYNAPLNSDTF
jgi:methyl-accepting chemotaxis protein